jgi:uncharacterized membrane protein YbhN (UPF0104 family)
MKKKLVTVLGFAVLGALIYWYLSDPTRRGVLGEQIARVGWKNFGLITLGTFGFILFQGFVLLHSVKPYGVKLGFFEHFGIIVVTFFSNYLIPFLGFGIRGVYLKHKHGLAYRDFSQSLMAVVIIEWTIFAVMAVLASLWLAFQGDSISILIVILMVGVIGGFVFAFAVQPGWIPAFLPLSGFIKTVLEDWQSYTANRKTLGYVALFTALEAACFALAFVVAYKALFPAVPPAASIVASALSDLSLIVRILPASAGSLEGALHLSMLPYGLQFSDNLTVALITRAALAVIFVPLGPLFFWALLVNSGIQKQAKREKISSS